MGSDRLTIGTVRYQRDHGGPDPAGWMSETRVEPQAVRDRARDAAGAQIGFNQRPGGGLRLGPKSEGDFRPLLIRRFVSFGIVLLLRSPEGGRFQLTPTPQSTGLQASHQRRLGAAGMTAEKEFARAHMDRKARVPVVMGRATCLPAAPDAVTTERLGYRLRAGCCAPPGYAGI
jgi:hypothetical protein